MSYYMPTVLTKSVGLPEKMARLLSACNAVSYLFFSGIAVLLIERMGRRGLMLLSTFGQFVCFLVITVLLRYSATSDNGSVYGNASVAFFFLYYGAFGIGMLGVPWLYPTEINSLPMRTKGAAAATATDWYVSECGYTYWLLIFNKIIGSRTSSSWRSPRSEFKVLAGSFGLSGRCPMPFSYLSYTSSTRRQVRSDAVPCCFSLLTVIVANRSLEDLDAYYRTNPSLIVTGDPDAICRKRPQKYIEREDEEFERTAVSKGVMPVEAADHVEWTEAERQR